MKQLDPVVLRPTRYTDPEEMCLDYRAWYEGNMNRKTEFTDVVDFHRTAIIGQFLLFWVWADYFEDMAILLTGKQPILTLLPD